MNITLTFRHMDATEAIKDHIQDKLEHLKKYLIRPIDAHVIISVEKFRQRCEIVLVAKNFRVTSDETSDNLYTSIDLAVHKLESQVRKHKEIIKSHKFHYEKGSEFVMM